MCITETEEIELMLVTCWLIPSPVADSFHEVVSQSLQYLIRRSQCLIAKLLYRTVSRKELMYWCPHCGDAFPLSPWGMWSLLSTLKASPKIFANILHLTMPLVITLSLSAWRALRARRSFSFPSIRLCACFIFREFVVLFSWVVYLKQFFYTLHRVY